MDQGGCEVNVKDGDEEDYVDQEPHQEKGDHLHGGKGCRTSAEGGREGGKEGS